jgi:hypothetical protein
MGVTTRAPKKNNVWARPFIFIISALALSLSLISYNSQDPSLNTLSQEWREPKNLLGYLGSWSSDAFLQLFGYMAWAWPLLFFIASYRYFKNKDERDKILSTNFWISLFLFLCASTLFVSLIKLSKQNLTYPPEGLLGVTLLEVSRAVFGVVGSYFVVVVFLWSFCLLWWQSLPQKMGHTLLNLAEKIPLLFSKLEFLKARIQTQATTDTSSELEKNKIGINAELLNVKNAKALTNENTENVNPLIRNPSIQSSENNFKQKNNTASPGTTTRRTTGT